MLRSGGRSGRFPSRGSSWVSAGWQPPIPQEPSCATSGVPGSGQGQRGSHTEKSGTGVLHRRGRSGAGPCYFSHPPSKMAAYFPSLPRNTAPTELLLPVVVPPPRRDEEERGGQQQAGPPAIPVWNLFGDTPAARMRGAAEGAGAFLVRVAKIHPAEPEGAARPRQRQGGTRFGSWGPGCVCWGVTAGC